MAEHRSYIMYGCTCVYLCGKICSTLALIKIINLGKTLSLKEVLCCYAEVNSEASKSAKILGKLVDAITKRTIQRWSCIPLLQRILLLIVVVFVRGEKKGTYIQPQRSLYSYRYLFHCALCHNTVSSVRYFCYVESRLVLTIIHRAALRKSNG